MDSHHPQSFPIFKKFHLTDMGWYEKFYLNFNPHCDYHLYNLYSWLDVNNDLEFTILNKNVVFRYTDPFSLSNTKQLSLIGENEIDKTISVLFETILSSANNKSLVMLPEETINALKDATPYHITEERDNFDYILDGAKIAHLSGSDIRNLRRDCNAFMRRYSEDLLIQERRLNTQFSHYLINNLHTWDRAFTTTNNDELKLERRALDRLLRKVDLLDLWCLTVKICGKLEGFAIYHYAPEQGYVMVNSLKVSYRQSDIYDFMIFALANRTTTEKIRYINFEQDLGIAGLRQYKTSLRPVRFLKRYTLKHRIS